MMACLSTSSLGKAKQLDGAKNWYFPVFILRQVILSKIQSLPCSLNELNEEEILKNATYIFF